MTGFRWERDKHGDALWLGDTFLGCVYDRRPYQLDGEWRVLLGEDMVFLADVKPTHHQPDARLGARQALEEECGWAPKIPSAQELLEVG
ncbi:MAG: hypothetical protein IJI97_06635 [Clostridia bacterium]|nr:hypothetical protein [Clostridia bacterium]